MRIALLGMILAMFSGFSAAAEDYTCKIERYGSPVNFAGSFQRQRELMASWMPAETFYLYRRGGPSILHHSGGENGQTPASDETVNGQTIGLVFIDHPVSSANTSDARRITMTLNTGDNSFTLRLALTTGGNYKQAGGTAWGHCTLR